MLIEEVDLSNIRNRNEERVAEFIAEILEEFEGSEFQDLDVQDIYALTLNKLPSRYVQRMTIILKEPVSDDEIKDAIRESAKAVLSHPNH